MKTLKLLSVSLALSVCIMMQAQITSEAVVGNCPSLPTPQQYAAGNTQAFKDKIAELQGKLAQQQANLIPNVTQKDLDESAAHQRSQQEQLNKQMQQNFGFNTADMANMTEAEFQAKAMGGLQNAQAQAMADLNRQMAALASLGITEADMKKMEKMNDKQAEAYMKKRLTENGYTEADFGRRMMEAGAPVLSEAEWKEEERREREAEAQGQAIIKAQETLEAFMHQQEVANRHIDEAREIATRKVEALKNKYDPMIAEETGKSINCVENRIKGLTNADCESYMRKADALATEYRAEAYRAWAEYILAAQGRLKVLLSYASAADAAKANMPGMTGNAATDQLQRMSDYAISVAAQYLNVTDSEP